MIGDIQLKVCGLTLAADADAAQKAGADYLGFVLHERSPRHISLAQFKEIKAELPAKPKVAVVVEPGPGIIKRLVEVGFDLFQVHFRKDVAMKNIESWAVEAGAGNLWLAPKLPHGSDADPAWLALARTVLLDTFDQELFGGTGRTGDWRKFHRHTEGYPDTTWILSGGLNPENVQAALETSGAHFVDVSSGVESSPGVKDQGKIRAFAAAVRASQAG